MGYTSFEINKIKQPDLFALSTTREFNVLPLEILFADKLSTLGPNTIGISDERSDEQIKQIYDLISLYISNKEQILKQKDLIKYNYEIIAKEESRIHKIEFNLPALLNDMNLMIKRVKNIEFDERRTG